MNTGRDIRGSDGEYDYTRGKDNQQLLKNLGARDKNLNEKLRKDAENVQILKSEA